jgi:hypothetical protein
MLSLAIVVMIAVGAAARLASPTAPAAAVQTAVQSATSASFVDQGKGYLASHNILAARDAFQQAVAADPTDQAAQFFYGMTRVVAVYEDNQSLNTTALDSVREVLEQCGFIFGTYNVYGTTTTKTPKEIAATTPNTGAVMDFLATNLLPQINGAIDNLAAVSNTAFSTTLDTAGIGKPGGGTITVDYADVVMLKTLLYGLQCQLKLIQVYGLDFSPPQIAGGDPKELMRYRQLLQNDATLLAPKNPSFLTDARAALVSFIDTYGAAIDNIRQRATQAGHLFVLDQLLAGDSIGISSPGVDDFRSALAEVKASLAGPHLFTFAKAEDQYRVIDLSKFFNAAAPLNPRQLAVDCGSGVAIPDPTFGGLLPLGVDMTGTDRSFYVNKNDLKGVVCSDYTAPKISLSDPGLSFSDYPANAMKSPASRLSIKNVGTADLHVSSLGLIGGDAASFTIQDETCGGTSPTLAPGEKCSVIVDFAPATLGNKSAAVQVPSDDAFNPNAYTQLTGMQQQPLPATGVGGFKAVVPHPTNTAIVYAASYGGGVFKSSDGGANWSATNNGLTDKRVTSLVMQPGTPTTLFAGTLGGGVFWSPDGGASWAAANNGLTSLYVNSLAVSPDNPSLIYAGTHKGIFKSTNGGALWTTVSIASLPGIGVLKLTIDPANQAVVYALVNGQLCKTGDGGLTWTTLGDKTVKVTDFALAPSAPQTVYISSFDGTSMVNFFRSSDGGQTWTQNGPVMSFGINLTVDPSNPQTVYVPSNNNNGLYKSTDGGMNWTVVGYPPYSTAAFAISPVSATVMYSGSYVGVATSTNGGVTWSAASISLPITIISVILKDPVTPTTLYAAGSGPSGVLKSTDDGATWLPANSGLGGNDVRDLLALTGMLFAATDLGLYTSTNGGSSWTLVSNMYYFSALAASTDTNPVIYGAWGSSVYFSSDNGANWSSASLGASVNKLAVSGSTVYAATSKGLYKSTDGGVNWSLAGLAGYVLNTIFIDPANSSTLYAGTISGAFKSTDGGTNWSAVNTGLPTSSLYSRYNFVVNPATPSTLYVVTDSGLYRTTNGGSSWTSLDLGGASGSAVVFPAASGKIIVGGHSGIYLLPIPAGTAPAQYNLAMTLAGSGGGSVSYQVSMRMLPPGGGTCATSPCTTALTEGSQVVLTPVPNAGSVFTSWAGCDVVSGESCSVSMYGARNVTATFSPDPEPLTVLASPPGGSYPVIQDIYLAASKPAVIHFTLDGTTPTANSPVYSGPLSIAGSSTTLKYYATAGGASSADKTENYAISHYSLTVNQAGTGNGTVNSITSRFPFSCAGSSCSASFPGGAQLTLHASPAAGSLFNGWSGACTGSSDCLLAITAATGVTATFNTMPNVRIPLATPVYFATLQDALDAATGSAPIQAVGMEFAESLILNHDVALILKGGYDSAFSPTSGMTYLDGILTIGLGSLTLENFAIK